MKRAYKIVAKALSGTGFLEYFCAAIIAVLVIITFANVLLRYFFNSPIVGVDEFGLFVFVWAAYAGALIAFKRHRHYSVSMLAELLPPLPRAIFDAITQIIVMAVLLIMIFYSYKVNVLLQFDRSPALEIPIYFVYSAFPIMSIGMMVYAIVDFIELVRVKFLGLEPVYIADNPPIAGHG